MSIIEQLLPFLKIYTENWGERTLVLVVFVSILYYIYTLIIKLLNVAVLIIRGYPPAHTDIDGGGYETVNNPQSSSDLPYGISIKEKEEQKEE